MKAGHKAKGDSRTAATLKRGEMALNNDMLWPDIDDAWLWVLGIQRKLHRWTKADTEKKFDDLFNLVHDRNTLLVAWDRIRNNRGSRTAGVDGKNRWHVENCIGVWRSEASGIGIDV